MKGIKFLVLSLFTLSCIDDNKGLSELGEIWLSFNIEEINHSIGIESAAEVIDFFLTEEEGYWIENFLGRGNSAFITYKFHFRSENCLGTFEFRNLYDTTILEVENYNSSKDWWEFKDINDFYNSFELIHYPFLSEPDPKLYPGMVFRLQKSNRLLQTYLDYNHLNTRDSIVNYEEGFFSIKKKQPFVHPIYGEGIKVFGEFECTLFELVTNNPVSVTDGQFTLFFKKP